MTFDEYMRIGFGVPPGDRPEYDETFSLCHMSDAFDAGRQAEQASMIQAQLNEGTCNICGYPRSQCTAVQA